MTRRPRVAALLLLFASLVAIAVPLVAAHQGQIIANESGSAPTLSACGTATVAGNDTAGIITHTVGASACTVTFGNAFTNAPSCVAQLIDDTTTAQNEGSWVREIAVAAADFTVHYEAASSAANKYVYICIGR